MRLSRILVSLVAIAASTTLQAVDSVYALPTGPTAYEQDQVPGQVTFYRTGSGGALTVTYTIGGTALSNLHGGYIAGLDLTAAGDDYRRNSFPLVITNGGAGGGAPTLVAQGTALGVGGQITGVTIGLAGTLYDNASPPAIAFRDPISLGSSTDYGSGGAGRVILTGYVAGLDLTNGGIGYTSDPTVVFSGGAGSGATATATAAGGVVTVLTYPLGGPGGSGYTSAPTVAFQGGGATTAATATASLSYKVKQVNITSQGTGYVAPTATIDVSPGGGTSATVTAVSVQGNEIDSLRLDAHGYGYALSTVNITDSTGTGAVAHAVVKGGAVQRIVVENPGSAYALPTVSFTGGGGSGATARVSTTGGRITSVLLDTPGTGYTSAPTVTLTAATGAGAVIVASVAGGQVVDLSITNAGAGYPTPTIAVVPAAGYAGAGASGEALVDADGRISAINVLSAGSGYPAPSVTINDTYGAGATGTALVGYPDYQVRTGALDPGVGSVSLNSSGVLTGTITFLPGEVSKTLTIVPLRNGVVGGRRAVVNISPSSIGTYTVDQRSSATVSIADADATASIAVDRATAFPTPPAIESSVLPLEIQGRGEWHLTMGGDSSMRAVAVQVQADARIGPLATQGTDYDLVWNDIPMAQTVNDYTVVVPVDPAANPMPAAPGPGASTCGVAYINVVANDVITFESPDNILNGYYVVTGTAGPAQAGQNPTVTFTPAMRLTQTTYGTTRIRRIGRLVTPPVSGTLINTIYTAGSDLYYWAFPQHTGTPRGRRSVALNLVQSDDFRTLSPTVGTVTVADDAVTAGLRFNANASKPETKGSIDVVLTGAFPTGTDIDVPFAVLASSTAVYGTDYTIPGYDQSMGYGTIRVPAGSTTARIEIAPLPGGSGLTKSVSLQLLSSPDYLLAPAGTSNVNPMASLFISPQLQAGGQPVYMAIARVQDAAEPATAGQFRVYLSDATGAALAGMAPQNIGVTYTAGGTAVAGRDYQALPGSAMITAGTNSTLISVPVIDNATVDSSRTLSLTLGNGSGAGYALSALSFDQIAIVDDEPTLRVTRLADAVEGGANGTFVIESVDSLGNLRSVPRDIDVTFTVAGTATSGTDYNMASSPIRISSGNSSVTITVVAQDDTVVDPDETVIVALAADPSYAIDSAAPTATMLITESINLGTVSVVAVDGDLTTPAIDTKEGSAPVAAAMRVSLARSGRRNSTMTVPIQISGSASNGIDYQALPTGVTFPELTLANAVVAGPISGIYLKLKDTTACDIPAGTTLRLGVDDPNTVADESVTVTTASAVSVAATSTYVPLVSTTSLTASFALDTSVGVCTQDVAITPIDDALSEGNETVGVTLVSGTLYTVGAPSTATVILVDDEGSVVGPSTSYGLVTVAAVAPATAQEAATPTAGILRISLVRGTGVPATDANPTLTIPVVLGGTALPGVDYVQPAANAVLPGLRVASNVAIGATFLPLVLTDTASADIPAGATLRVDVGAAAYTVVTAAAVTVASATTPTMVQITTALPAAASSGTSVGQCTLDVAITPINDAISEGDETAQLTLSSGTGYTLGAAVTATITIKDDEGTPPAPGTTYGTVTVAVVAPGTAQEAPTPTAGTFRISINRVVVGGTDANPTLTVPIAMSGSAQSGTDYTAPLASVVLPELRAVFGAQTGDTSIWLGTVDTSTYSLPVGAVLRIGTGAGAVTATVAEAVVVNATWGATVKLATPFVFTVAVAINTPVGVCTQDVTITPKDDTLVEGSETVVLTLGAGTTYTLGSAASATLTLLDDETPATGIAPRPDPSTANTGDTSGGGGCGSGGLAALVGLGLIGLGLRRRRR